MMLARLRLGFGLSHEAAGVFRRGFASAASTGSSSTGASTEASETKPELPPNVRFVDESVLEPELKFEYTKGAKLPLSKFIVEVLEGPFATPKAPGKLSPVGKLYLSEEVFRTDVRPDIMARVVRWQRNRWQQGTHKAKTKAEVSGTGKKPYKQKGTGLARQGSLRNPHFRKGGAAFGPEPRDHDHELNKKERRLGLRSALCARLQEGRFHVIDSLAPRVVETKPETVAVPAEGAEQENKEEGGYEEEEIVYDSNGELLVRTKQIASHLKKLGVENAVLVDVEQRSNVYRACKNIPAIHYVGQIGLNVFALLKFKEVVLTVDAIRALEERLSETNHRSRRYMKKGFTAEEVAYKEAKDAEAKAADASSPKSRIERRRELFKLSQQRRDMDPEALLREAEKDA